MSSRRTTIEELCHLIMFSDSALPVGGFSFSCGLESAVTAGMVKDEATLGAFLHAVVRQSAFCDGVATLTAHRARLREDWERAFEADRLIGCFKSGREARRMSLRMGQKLIDLSLHLHANDSFRPWYDGFKSGVIEGHYASTQGVLFATASIDERALFAAHLYGVASQVCGAALRLLRIDHFATQRLLYGIAPLVCELYEHAAAMRSDQMHLFAPECEILASMHEYGNARMFMN